MLKFTYLISLSLFLFMLLEGFGYLPLGAQNTDYPIIINSNPVGASVELAGDCTIIGQTPCHIRHELAGRYRLKVVKPGYETKNQLVTLAFNEPRNIEIQLTRKSRWKAGFRSFALPGWGQHYSERPLTGLVLGSTFFTSFIIFSYTSYRYNQEIDKYEDALSNLRQPLENAAYEQMLGEALEKGQATDQAYKMRKKWAWITASIFTYNLIDAILFFPKFNDLEIRQTNFFFSLNTNSNLAGCSLSLQF